MVPFVTINNGVGNTDGGEGEAGKNNHYDDSAELPLLSVPWKPT